MLTLQQVFTKVAAHLLKQGRRSRSVVTVRVGLNSPGGRLAVGDCAYRSGDGCACAVGCLIDDDHYSQLLEGFNTRQAPVIEALVASGVPATDPDVLEMLDRLQDLHDRTSPDGWADALPGIASEFDGIRMPEVRP